MLGAIAGDIVGSPFEWDNVKTEKFTLFTYRSNFTDDTVMTLAIADGIMKAIPKKGMPADEEIFSSAIINSMQYLGNRYPNVGYGTKFYEWLSSDSREPYNSFGNGSAMRVSPVAWAFENLSDVEKFAALSAAVTHNHPEGIKGAQATAAAIFLARTGKSKTEIRDYITEKYNYDLTRTLDEIRPSYEFNATCQGSVPEAIIAFLEGKNFEDTMRKAISLGGDSDTIAAIACSIAEGCYEIPENIISAALEKLDDFLADILLRFEQWLA